MQCLASLLIPNDGCLPLVGNANGLYAFLRMAVFLKDLQSSFYTVVHGLHNLFGVMFVPTGDALEDAEQLRL